MFNLINIKHELLAKNHSDFQYNSSWGWRGGQNQKFDNIRDHT